MAGASTSGASVARHRVVSKSAAEPAASREMISAVAYLRAAHAAGCRDPLCLRWLTISLVATGEIDQAREVVLQWQKVDPSNPELSALKQSLGLQVPDSNPSRVRIDGAKISADGEMPHLDGPATISMPNSDSSVR